MQAQRFPISFTATPDSINFSVLHPKGVQSSEATVKEAAVQLVRQNVGALASFKEVHVVKRLPKTRSGKTARNTLSAMLAGESYKVPAAH